ncbi:MAG TPA: M48 family metalloprotease [Acidimicrobiales bacterium]|nr:M48 family metalloprotease [Acidimicrobiales bacterium]
MQALSERSVWGVTATFALPPAAVLGIVLGFTAGWPSALAVSVVLAAALCAWALFAGDAVVAASIGGREADPRTDARLWNLVEGLSIGAGVRQPRLLVVDSPGLNALAAGTSPNRAVLAVTTGLLDELKRIELEGVLAEEIFLIRHGHTRPATVVAATWGVGRRFAVPADRDAVADLGAVSLTRYPPALASALEKVEAKGAVVAGQTSRLAHLWLADPRPDAVVARGRLPLSERVEALREL